MRARLVISTISSQEEGEKLITKLVEKGVVACGNLLPRGVSIYQWQGKVEREEEYLLLLKTTDEKLEEVMNSISEEHPYDVPEIVALTPEAVSEPYLEWLIGCVEG